VSVEKVETKAAEVACSVLVDDRFHFKVELDSNAKGYKIRPSIFTRKQPSTFRGRMGIADMQAVGTAECPNGKPPVYASITLSFTEEELYADSQGEKLEQFLNVYIPGVKKLYSCN
jgi:hypothetical protein